jgi:hypothetical protein
MVGPSGGNSDGVVAAWEALTASGQRGLALDLGQLALLARASSKDMTRLLELAGEDPHLRSLLLAAGRSLISRPPWRGPCLCWRKSAGPMRMWR